MRVCVRICVRMCADVCVNVCVWMGLCAGVRMGTGMCDVMRAEGWVRGVLCAVAFGLCLFLVTTPGELLVEVLYLLAVAGDIFFVAGNILNILA